MTFSDYLNDLKGRRVAVVGAGVSNTPLIKALIMAGVDTTVCDKMTLDELGETARMFRSHGARLRLGAGYLDGLDADVVFRTPGIMPSNAALRSAVARGAELTSEIEVFFDVCPCRIIAVTGSDGKTTTTSIISEILRKEGYRVHIGGNIGAPLLCDADDMSADDIVVLELSSFQLITMKKCPEIAVVTNISPNHLDVHTDMNEYIEAKRNIFIRQKKCDRAIINYDNDITRSLIGEAGGEVLLFSRRTAVEDGVYCDKGVIYRSTHGESDVLMPTNDIRLPGAHNIENYMAAFAAVRGLASRESMVETARVFGGVEHRIEFVRELRGVRYYNDSIASSPSRTIAGLKSFDQKVILIAGGKDKGVPFDELGCEISQHVKTLVLTGMTAEVIREAVEGGAVRKPDGEDAEAPCNDDANAPGDERVCNLCDTFSAMPDNAAVPEIIVKDEFEDAILAASGAAAAGDVVLLSPACTSFDRFKNFEERGELFKKIVKELV